VDTIVRATLKYDTRGVRPRDKPTLSVLSLPLILSIAIPALCVIFLEDAVLLYAIIVFGQAHFLITYFYMHKAGKLTRPFLLRFLALAIALGIVCSVIVRNPEYGMYLILVTSLLFLVHYLNDEWKIAGESQVTYRLLALLSGVAAFAAVFAQKTFGLAPLIYLGLASASAVLLIAFIILSLRGSRPAALLFPFSTILALYATLFLPMVSVMDILGFIVLFHYLRWYLHYFARFSGEARSFYWDVVIWGHIFVILVFVQFMLAPRTGIAHYFFEPTFFFGWTIMHILLSVRASDFRTI
jgi:hypothetical protein